MRLSATRCAARRARQYFRSMPGRRLLLKPSPRRRWRNPSISADPLRPERAACVENHRARWIRLRRRRHSDSADHCRRYLDPTGTSICRPYPDGGRVPRCGNLGMCRRAADLVVPHGAGSPRRQARIFHRGKHACHFFCGRTLCPCSFDRQGVLRPYGCDDWPSSGIRQQVKNFLDRRRRPHERGRAALRIVREKPSRKRKNSHDFFIRNMVLCGGVIPSLRRCSVRSRPALEGDNSCVCDAGTSDSA